MVNKKNRREAVKNAPFNRYNGVLNHLTTEKYKGAEADTALLLIQKRERSRKYAQISLSGQDI